MTEQIKTLTNAVELLSHSNAAALAQSVNRKKVDDDIPPPLEDVADGNDAEGFKR